MILARFRMCKTWTNAVKLCDAHQLQIATLNFSIMIIGLEGIKKGANADGLMKNF